MQEGDLEAFWTLWQRFRQRLFALCLHEMHGNRADAEDALEQAMLKAAAKYPSCALCLRCPEAWLVRITGNVCKDVYRMRVRTAIAAERWRETKPQQQENEERIERSPTNHNLDPVLLVSMLPGRLREVFSLRMLQQMPYKDIARQLELTCSAARKRVQEARVALQAWRDRGEIPVERQVRRHCVVPPPHTRVTRTRQKIRTLRSYVARHPTGWKMRLRLADLLYATGDWADAADQYRSVLSKRPWLAGATDRLARIVSTTDV